MASVKETYLYSEVIKELNYSFGDVFIFSGYVIAEMKSGVNISWDKHAKHMVQDIAYFLGTDGKDIIYISNRINSYAVKAADWLKFFKSSYHMKSYYVVTSNAGSKINLMIENLFFNNKIKSFQSLLEAVNWAKKGAQEVA